MKLEEIRIRPDSFLVSGDKTFFTLQGEGQSLGKPATFLRLHLCNLHCVYCDSRYTWDRTDSRFYTEPERWSLDQAAEAIRAYPAKRLVITGGEPLLHGKALVGLAERLPDFDLEVETNGTISPPVELKARAQFNVSPKLSNSSDPENLRIRGKVLRELNDLPNTTFKFVVQNEQDVKEVREIVNNLDLDVNKVILMPEGTDQDAIAEHGRAVAEICKTEGFRLVPRLQIMLWGSRRKT